jgi:hypothetical protein
MTPYAELLAKIMVNGLLGAEITEEEVRQTFDPTPAGSTEASGSELAELSQFADADVLTATRLTNTQLLKQVREWATDNNLMAHPPLPNRPTWIFVVK